MGETAFLKNPTFGNETYFGTNGEYTGNSARLGLDAVTSKLGKINAKFMLNTNAKSEISPQVRITSSTPDLKLAQAGNTIFKANAENWTTLKFDKNLEKQDIANSARVKLKAQNGDYSIYSAFKFDCSQKNPQINFNGATVGVQKNWSQKLSTYIDCYLPKTCFQGNLKNTSYALGVSFKL